MVGRFRVKAARVSRSSKECDACDRGRGLGGEQNAAVRHLQPGVHDTRRLVTVVGVVPRADAYRPTDTASLKRMGIRVLQTMGAAA